MKISATAILTLATLAAANVTQQATAAPTKSVTPTTKTDDLVVPVIEDTPTRIETIASPETIVAQQFSQNTSPVPTTVNNNSTIVLKPVDKATLKQKGIDIADEILRETLSNLVTRDLCDVSNLQGKPTYNEMNVENVRISHFGNKFLNIVNGES